MAHVWEYHIYAQRKIIVPFALIELKMIASAISINRNSTFVKESHFCISEIEILNRAFFFFFFYEILEAALA